MASAKQAPTPSAAAAPSPSASSAPSPRIPAAHTPTPAQQNPQAKRPLAPSLPEKSGDSPDPVKALRERQSAAIASRVAGHEREQVSGAGVDGASLPPKRTPNGSGQTATPKTSAATAAAPASSGSAPNAGSAKEQGKQESPTTPASGGAAQPSTEDANTPSQSSDTTDEPGEAEPTADASNAKRGPRYDLKGLKRWAEENPEAAAEAAKAIFAIDVDAGFVRLQNKARKIKGEIREQRSAAEKAAQEKLAEAKAAQAEAERIAGSLRYMADMWAAAQRKDDQGRAVMDFDTIDESFRQNTGGITIDEYMRQRARRGVSSPELARERAQRLRLEAELAQLKGGQNTSAAEGAQKSNGAAPQAGHLRAQDGATPAAPQVNPEELWGDEVPKTHQLREFRGWADELHREMQRHYDETLDEYSVDPEEIADKLLQRKLAAFAPEEPEPAQRRTPVAPKKPSTPRRRAAPAEGVPSAAELTPRGHRPAAKGDLEDEAPASFADRERWALERARRRLRGEAVE